MAHYLLLAFYSKLNHSDDSSCQEGTPQQEAEVLEDSSKDILRHAFTHLREMGDTPDDAERLFEEWLAQPSDVEGAEGGGAEVEVVVDDEGDHEGELLDPVHQLRTKHAALILLMLMFEWDHKVPLKKVVAVCMIGDYFLRREERRKCQILCLVCHFARTISSAGSDHPPVPLDAFAQEKLLMHVAAKRRRQARQGGVCCGTTYRPGRRSECVHEPSWPGWLATFQKIWPEKKHYWDRSGLLTAMQFFARIVGRWDHIVSSIKNKNVSTINDLDELLSEIKLCQLLCPFCHNIKTFFNRDTVRWSYLSYAVQPYTDGTTSGGRTARCAADPVEERKPRKRKLQGAAKPTRTAQVAGGNIHRSRKTKS